MKVKSSLMRFLVVGGVMGVLTVAAREVLGRLVFPGGGLGYASSVMVVYLMAIFCSFALHRVVTFGASRKPADGSLLRYAAVSLASAAFTSLLATVLCFGMGLDYWLGEWTPALSFTLAALLVALIAYYANARWVFKPASLQDDKKIHG